MRLFLALDVDKQGRDVLYTLQGHMKKLGVKGSYVPIENFHVTLRFLGETKPLKAMMKSMDEKLQKTAFYVDHITLYESVRDKAWSTVPCRKRRFNYI